MRILAIGDIHMGEFSDFAGPEVRMGLTNRALEPHAVLNEITDIIRIRKPDGVVLLGDVFHDGRKISALDVCVLQNLVRLTSMICPVVAISGNHDQVGQGGTALSIIERDALVVHEKVRHEFGCAFVPEGQEDVLREMISDGPSHIFWHGMVRGASLGHGFTSPTGLDLLSSRSVRIIAGDVHHPQTISFGKGLLVYAGTCCPRTFSDSGVCARVLMIDTEKPDVIDVVPVRTAPYFNVVRSGKDLLDAFGRTGPVYLWLRGPDRKVIQELQNAADSISSVAGIRKSFEREPGTGTLTLDSDETRSGLVTPEQAIMKYAGRDDAPEGAGEIGVEIWKQSGRFE